MRRTRRTHRIPDTPRLFRSVFYFCPRLFIKPHPKAGHPHQCHITQIQYTIVSNIPKYAPTHTRPPTYGNPHLIPFPICLCPRTCGPSNLKVRPKSNGTSLYIYIPVLPYYHTTIQYQSAPSHTHLSLPPRPAVLFPHRKGKKPTRLDQVKPLQPSR